MFIGPAVIMLLAYLVIQAVATIVASFTEKGAPEKTWGYVLTSPEMWLAFRNNIIWMVVGAAGSVGIGLAVAALFDRIKREALAKVFIFLPLAISMVGASVIWRFMYAWQPEGEPQIGLVNAVWTAAGNEPVALMQVSSPPVNTMALIVIMIWLQTGFAMVILSAALKGVPTEVIANRMFNEMFAFRNYGRASAIAVILFVAVIPIMVVNIRNLRRQGIGR